MNMYFCCQTKIEHLLIIEIYYLKKINCQVLQLENQYLKKRIKQWEVEESSSGKKTASPAQMTHEISKLQKSQVVLLEKQSDLLAR